LIGGTFTSYDGVGRNRIARLNNGPVGIQEVDTQNMSVFPNPSQRSVSVSTSMTGPLVITVTDLTGKLILKDFAQGSTAQPIMIRLDDQEPGPYFVSLAGKSGTVTERIIVQ
jgi:hypothetical protein